MYNIYVLQHSKIVMFWLTLLGISFLFYMPMHDMFKKKICKEYKSKKNQNAFKMIVSLFLEDVGVMRCTSKVIVPIK